MTITLNLTCAYCLHQDAFKAYIKSELGTTPFFRRCPNCEQEFIAEVRLKVELTTSKKTKPVPKHFRMI